MKAIAIAKRLKAQAIELATDRVALHTEAYKLSTNEGKRAALKTGLSKSEIREVQSAAKQDYVKVGIALGASLLTAIVD